MKKILVIDDSELVSKLLQEALHVAGYDVAIGMDANQGYSQALEFHPDLILLDVQLPDITGFELCRVIKNRDELRHIPIIMITGTAHRTEEKVKGFQSGADDYVMKPFEMPELLARIEAILRRSETRVATPAAVELKVIELPAAVSENEFSLPSHDVLVLSLKESIRRLLTHPFQFPNTTSYPPVSKLYLLVSIGLSLIGLTASSGGNLKPISAAMAMAALWGLMVSLLVIASSIMGIALSWTEGAALISLAGLPLGLKLIGGVGVSIITTLSPFYFTASPALFVQTDWTVLRRIDLFEMWSVFLLWILLRRRPQSDAAKVRLLVLIVWIGGLLLGIGFERWVVGL